MILIGDMGVTKKEATTNSFVFQSLSVLAIASVDSSSSRKLQTDAD
jgi:hypothetical protein